MNIKILFYKNYLKRIESSVGSEMFKNLYANVEGNEKDILENGGISCAFYVSNILFSHKLIETPHATVLGTIKDMENSGWYETNEPKPGAVVLWENIKHESGNEHFHIGFYIDENIAISHWEKYKTPVKHHITFNNSRNIEKFYWKDELDKEFY